jgi:hypothetical protein
MIKMKRIRIKFFFSHMYGREEHRHHHLKQNYRDSQ